MAHHRPTARAQMLDFVGRQAAEGGQTPAQCHALCRRVARLAGGRWLVDRRGRRDWGRSP